MNIKTVTMKMPDLATNEGAELAITKWLVSVGGAVRRGQSILEIETDKSAMEVEAIADGTLIETHVSEGDAVTVGTPIATIKVS